MPHGVFGVGEVDSPETAYHSGAEGEGMVSIYADLFKKKESERKSTLQHHQLAFPAKGFERLRTRMTGGNKDRD